MYHLIDIVDNSKKSAATVPDEWLVLGIAKKYFGLDLMGIQLG